MCPLCPLRSFILKGLTRLFRPGAVHIVCLCCSLCLDLIPRTCLIPCIVCASCARLVGRVRALGTAAVDMCQVAVGGADAYYHIGMHCWDIAASAIIVQEAGGVVTDTDGATTSRHMTAA